VELVSYSERTAYTMTENEVLMIIIIYILKKRRKRRGVEKITQ
jgi:hypothetical protein